MTEIVCFVFEYSLILKISVIWTWLNLDFGSLFCFLEPGSLHYQPGSPFSFSITLVNFLGVSVWWYFLQDNAFTALSPNMVFIKLLDILLAILLGGVCSCDLWFWSAGCLGFLVTRREVLLSDQRHSRGHFYIYLYLWCRYLWSLLQTIFQSLIGCHKQAPSTPATNQVSKSLSLIQKLDFLFFLMSLGEAEWMSRTVWACKRETGIKTQYQCANWAYKRETEITIHHSTSVLAVLTNPSILTKSRIWKTWT